MAEEEERRQAEGVLREKTSDFFGYVEDVFYIAVAGALVLVGFLYLAYTVYDFVKHVVEGGDLPLLVIELLGSLLLVFIFTEIIHTIRVVIDEKILVAEPFLIVGIVAAIRRMVVLSAEAQELLGKPEFDDAMLELAILAITALVLGATIFLLRRTATSEPVSEHEPD
ncbi:MAG: phosphate-starvation-inducible PsiE family protein [Actinomycetota bacterium]|nr:phosphate-starvation-inducible PsiE family protein [Actinomycetota bacterium]